MIIMDVVVAVVTTELGAVVECVNFLFYGVSVGGSLLFELTDTSHKNFVISYRLIGMKSLLYSFGLPLPFITSFTILYIFKQAFLSRL